jgi:AcrR family transcriptional regulator
MKMKIRDLCQESGFSRSTIKQYLREGLLHPAEKVGFRSSYYDETHLRVLGRIRYLRKQEKLPYNRIKQILATMSGQTPVAEPEQNDAVVKKTQIINKAIEFFSRNGVRGTKITDITNALGIGKSTFYLYFKNKRELYLECIDQLTAGGLIPQESLNKIIHEHDPLRRLRKRIEVALERFPPLIGIFNHVRHEMLSEDAELVKKAKNTFRLLIRPGVKDISWGVKHGYFRPINGELAGYFFIAMIEMLIYRLTLDDKFTAEEGIAALLDLFSYGALPHKNKNDKLP